MGTAATPRAGTLAALAAAGGAGGAVAPARPPNNGPLSPGTDGPGKLKILLKRAAGLKAADFNGKSDPYVKLTCGGKEHKSKVISKTLDPVWNETVDLTGTIGEFLRTGLLIKVYDKDMLTSDFLGDVRVPLTEMRTSVFHEYELMLSTQGKIFFSVSWLPERAQTIKSVAAAQSLISKMKKDAASSKAVATAADTKSLAALVAKHKMALASEAAATPVVTTPPSAAAPPPAARAAAVAPPPLPPPAPEPAPAAVALPAPPTPTTPRLDEPLKPPPELAECPEVPLLRAICMWPLALLWAPISCQALTLAFLGIAIVETPPALFAALQAIWLARRYGPIGKVINRRAAEGDRTTQRAVLCVLCVCAPAWACASGAAPFLTRHLCSSFARSCLCVLLSIVAVPVAGVVGMGVGFGYGAYVGGSFLAADASPDFVTAPTLWLRKGVYGSVRRRGEQMLRQDASLPAVYVPLDLLVLAPIVVVVLAVVTTPLVAIRLLAVAVNETPAVITAACTSTHGPKPLMMLLGLLMPVLLLLLTPVCGVVAGLIHGGKAGWLLATQHTLPDFTSEPAEQLTTALRSLFTPAMYEMIEKMMEPAPAPGMAPLGALGGALLAPVFVSLNLVAISVCPDALTKALECIKESRRIGPVAKIELQAVAYLCALVLLPLCALLGGFFGGFYFGAKAGWDFFAILGEPAVAVSAPAALWRERVLDRASAFFDELRRSEQELPDEPEFVIEANPLVLPIAAAVGLIGAVVMSLVYAVVSLIYMFPTAFKMYYANIELCSSDFKIIEAIFALTAYLVQVPLIPVYTLVITAWQPIEGFFVGFAKTAYSLIRESSAGHLKGVPGDCLLDAFGVSGILPALQRLLENIVKRWSERDKRVTKVIHGLTGAQENLLHCWSAAVVRKPSGGDDSPDSRRWSSRVSDEESTPGGSRLSVGGAGGRSAVVAPAASACAAAIPPPPPTPVRAPLATPTSASAGVAAAAATVPPPVSVQWPPPSAPERDGYVRQQDIEADSSDDDFAD